MTGMNFHHPAPIMCNQWFLTDKEFSPLAFFNLDYPRPSPFQGRRDWAAALKSELGAFFNISGIAANSFLLLFRALFIGV